MNKSLDALMTKLTWQLNDLNLQLTETQTQVQSISAQIQELDERINQAAMNSIVINPEFEINRLNFVTQQEGKKEELMLTLKNHQEIEEKLKEKIQRAKTELKMLEKYLEREQSCRQEQRKKAQDNALDEWVIQKRESA